MKTFPNIFYFFAMYFMLASAASALPKCPGSPSKNVEDFLRWSNCKGTWSNRVVSITVEMKNGKGHGFGTWRHARGDKYIGFFENSLPHGEGVMYYPNGEIDEGVWKNGNFQYSKSTPYTKKASKPSALKTAFVQLSQSDRTKVQENLKKLALYKSSIDGLYGKGTSGALNSYNSKYLGNSDLEAPTNASRLLSSVISHNFSPNQDSFETVEKPETPNAELKPNPKEADTTPADETRKVASGTGFYVSEEGHIITNHHVIDGCEEMKVHSKGKVFDTVQIASDAQNDLALLKVEAQPDHVFALSADGSFPLQDIIVAGFPFGDRVSSTLKFTKGIVSSVAGLGNNYSEIQIDAALQPGNSGGPIIDNYGNVIAVAVSKLDMKKILKDYGVIPENTNFGVKASVVKNLMQGNSVAFAPPNNDLISKSELSLSVTNGTVYLTCWMTTAQIQKLKNRKVMFSKFED